MKTPALTAGFVTWMALTLGAQDVKQQKAEPRTETVWTFQIQGISG